MEVSRRKIYDTFCINALTALNENKRVNNIVRMCRCNEKSTFEGIIQRKGTSVLKRSLGKYFDFRVVLESSVTSNCK